MTQPDSAKPQAKPDDGGPAFSGFSSTNGNGPCKPTYSPSGDLTWENYEPGMTLRDYFAAKVLAAMYADKTWQNLKEADIALCAYSAADAMIAARKL